ncbi:universal stress protein [Pontibacillus yanchengensis]|uniref:Universal stress protein UspA n=1 Tax=Pontibacillus yanchengensis Y32 TaxID=1385514 RepID=A0A0A2TJP7_9BACI|nr:universal stress protein [Pontibacillus yanchengensis]KGP74301.1 universal stress protein UspA [Pontibacillus yanchengensis Y32]
MMTKLLVAYDGSDLSKKALEEAMHQHHDGDQMELHILKVVSPDGPYSNPGLYHSIENSLVEKAKEDLQLMKQELEEKYETITVNTEALTGDPGNVISEYAKAHDIEMIVIGSRGLGNIKGWFLGSVSHRVVQQADCQVMIVK